MLHFYKQFQAETWTCIELYGIFDAVEFLLISDCRSDAAASDQDLFCLPLIQQFLDILKMSNWLIWISGFQSDTITYM